MPTPKTEYVVDFEKLIGGLNLYDPDYRLKLNESPDMENMLWKNGTLCSRYGQNWVTDATDRGVGYACFSDLFWDHAFFHIGQHIWFGKPDSDMDIYTVVNLSSVWHGTGTYSPERGTFLRYGDDLYYKAPGIFLKIKYQDNVNYSRSGDGTTKTFTINGLLEVFGITIDGTALSSDAYTVSGIKITFNTAPASGTNNIVINCRKFGVNDVASNAYVPITYVNANWETGAGDSYQPENRLSSKKTIWYNPGTTQNTTTWSGSSGVTQFALPADFVYAENVTVNGAAVGNYIISGGYLTFYTAPATGTNNIVMTYQKIVQRYYLPVAPDSIEKVVVDGFTKSSPSGYTFTAGNNYIDLVAAPNHSYPLGTNTIQITYSLSNPDAEASIMDCPYAIVYGGNQNICMVVGGCKAQPNAFFWNGNNVAMDVSYWPMEQYNLGGDTEDKITGFGRQQGYLVVFKERSVGKGELTFTTVDPSSDVTARTYIEIDYTNINSMTGCDLPWSIQLIENNLVFCNTQQGVHIILDSSAAYENNIITISRKVNGDNGRTGLLRRVREATNVSSFDDTKRYWIIADGRVFCWDYELSTYKDPSWFYLTNINAIALFMDVATIYHLGYNGRVTVFDTSYADYGNWFERRYQFATQYFRSYDRLKTVTGAIFTLRTDTDFNIQVTYLTDYEQRNDLTDIVSRTWRLVPRNLHWRDLSVIPFAFVAKRRPGCRHVRHFSMVLRCPSPKNIEQQRVEQLTGYDMPILSAQVFYRYEGRERGIMNNG